MNFLRNDSVSTFFRVFYKLFTIISFFSFPIPNCPSAELDSFDPRPIQTGSRRDSEINTIAIQPDESVVFAGIFDGVGTPFQSRNNIVRVDKDGNVDTNLFFGTDFEVKSVALQDDLKIVLVGSFTRIGPYPRDRIARFNPDGSLDSLDLSPSLNSYGCLSLSLDGSLFVGGRLWFPGPFVDYTVAKLNLNGWIEDFYPQPSNGDYGVWVSDITSQLDGKVLIGGIFSTLGGKSCLNAGRVFPDGKLDIDFHVENEPYGPSVDSFAIQPDNKIIVGGFFSRLAGQACTNLGRLNPDGTLDNSFFPSPDWWVVTLALQADGKILVGGHFKTIGEASRPGIARLTSNGKVDDTFNPIIFGPPEKDPTVFAITVQNDGKILAAGNFLEVNGQSRSSVARFHNTPATQSLFWDASGITWLRGGSSPEIWRSNFATSTNGMDWQEIGIGARVDGGWKLSNQVPRACLQIDLIQSNTAAKHRNAKNVRSSFS